MGVRAGMIRWLMIALAVTVSATLSTAQMRGMMGSHFSAAHGGFARGARIGGVRRQTSPFTGRRPFSPFVSGILLDSPYLDSDYDSNGRYDDRYAEENSAPQIVVVRPASVDDSPRRTRSAPLLIEWRGDRYVRFGGVEQTAERSASAHPDYAEPEPGPMTGKPLTSAGTKSAAQRNRTEAPAADLRRADLPKEELSPAVLVYRDGRHEEVRDYVIADGVIYTRGDVWQNAYGTRHIPLSTLDSNATIQANAERGVKFMLPSAPNVVITSF